MVRVGAGDDGCCNGPGAGDGLEPWRQFFGELRQCVVVFGEPAGEVFDGQGQAFGFGAGDSDHGVCTV